MQKSTRQADTQMKHLNVTVTGRVQGVYFRASTREVAESLGITGFVKNQSDGSVYLEAEGEEDTMNYFLLWLKRGPRASRVENLECTESKVKNMSGFEILR